MRSVPSVIAVLAVAASLAIVAAPAAAQMAGNPAAGYKRDAGLPASALPSALKEVGFDQHLNERIPTDVPFTDEHGRTVQLGDYFGRRPVVLAFVYFDCPMLCSQVLNATASALDLMSIEAGREFDVVAISFDPRETPAKAQSRKAVTLERYHHAASDAGWHFLTGDQAAIDRVTSAVGFRYTWDELTKQFAHPAGVVVLTPDARLARYLFGIEYGPRDLRLAIVEASEGTIGTVADSVLLYCYHYDPMTGRYGLVVMRLLRAGGIATVFAIASFVLIMLRRERRAPILDA
jgi:protein SCO1